ncbi:TrmH family RNA methyltransferase [Micromonospora sp. NPDC003197]
MRQHATPSGSVIESAAIDGTVIDEARHRVARRVADVLRASGGNQRIFLIDDEENIKQAIRCGVRLDSVYRTMGQAAMGGALLTAIPAGVPCQVLTDDVARALFGADKRSRVFALAYRPALPELSDLTDRPGDIVVLDGVRLMGNIGAVTRTACAFDAAGVVLVDSGLTSTVDRRLIRASRGMVFALPVILATRQQLQSYLHRQDIPLVSLSPHASAPLSTAGRIGRRLALLLGSERRGASESLEKSAARRYHVPTSPDVESLNVSVAAAIALYERRNRTAAEPPAPGVRKGPFLYKKR